MKNVLLHWESFPDYVKDDFFDVLKLLEFVIQMLLYIIYDLNNCIDQA